MGAGEGSLALFEKKRIITDVIAPFSAVSARAL
jgi:hypothetical protein